MLISGGIVSHLCLNSVFFIASRSVSLHPLNMFKSITRKLSTNCNDEDTIVKLKPEEINSEKGKKSSEIDLARRLLDDRASVYVHRRRHKGEQSPPFPPMQFWPLYYIAQIRSVFFKRRGSDVINLLQVPTIVNISVF